MGVPVDVALDGALAPYESAVRHAWSRCLRADATPRSDTENPAKTRPLADSEDPAPAETPGKTGGAGETDEPHDVVRLPAQGVRPTPEDPDLQRRSALDALSSAVTLTGIRRHRGRSLLFHAAGLADPVTGGTTVLVAASGTGKTTAAALLGRRLEYVSDETVCVAPRDLRVSPYPKPLSVITRGGTPKHQASLEELGLKPVTGPRHLCSLVLLERATPEGTPSEAAPAELTGPVPLVTALSTLVPNLSALPSLPHPLTTLLRTVAACGGVRIARYREVEDVADELVRTATDPLPARALAELVSWSPAPEDQRASLPDHRLGTGNLPGPLDPPDLPGPFEPSRPPAADDDAATRTSGSGPAAGPSFGDAPLAPESTAVRGTAVDPLPRDVALAPWVEAVENPEDPQQLLLLLPHRFAVLGGIAPDVWHACREHGALSVSELEHRLRAMHGDTPRAGEYTRECVRHLLGLGVLRAADPRTTPTGRSQTPA